MTSTTLEEKRVQEDIDEGKKISAQIEAKAKEKQARAERAEERRKHREQNPSTLRRVLGHLKPETTAGGIPLMVWSVFFRSVVLLTYYLMAVATAQGVIPALGMWLHQQSGAARGELNLDGTIAMWVMPLLFMVALLLIGEVALMRAMWRWSSRMIAKMRGSAETTEGTDQSEKTDQPKQTPAPAAKTTTRGNKKKRKRSK